MLEKSTRAALWRMEKVLNTWELFVQLEVLTRSGWSSVELLNVIKRR
jgi:hypothetical protein